MIMPCHVHRLNKVTLKDFLQVHHETHGSGWCYCVAWWVDTWDGWGKRTAEQNLCLRRQLVENGETDGFIFYADDQPVGWCQVFPRDRSAKLMRSYSLEPDPAIVALSCMMIVPQWRQRGMAEKMVQLVLVALVGEGVSCVEAYPRRGQKLPQDEIWTGPEALFKSCGFSCVREHEHFPVYRIVLPPAQAKSISPAGV